MVYEANRKFLAEKYDFVARNVRAALRRYGRDLENSSDDIIQEVCIRILTGSELRAANFSEQRSYVWTITRNLIVDKQKSKENVTRSKKALQPEAFPARESPTSDELIDDYAQAGRILRSLTMSQRKIIELRMAGHSYVAIAKKLNIPYGTVCSTISRASTKIGIPAGARGRRKRRG